MTDNRKPFKRPSKKHEPYGLSILFEDHDIIVVDKAAGLLTISTYREKEKTAFYLLNNYVKKGNYKSKSAVFIVHRLDRETSGVLVFAKSEKAKRFLQENWQSFTKQYVAVVHGILKEKEGEITSYLIENKAHRMYATNDTEKGAFAKTGFKVIKESNDLSLLEINLFTGKKNQIRVHLAEKGYPIVGDKMYGRSDKNAKRLALHAETLSIKHPYTKEIMTFTASFPSYFRTLIKT
ncbi:MAG: RluA family pseudouridine synthase [Cyclobacteriaceae bacterium]|nr:RluA family pseudouridine synthase [Cyclobacteriaceae bacterium]